MIAWQDHGFDSLSKLLDVLLDPGGGPLYERVIDRHHHSTHGGKYRAFSRTGLEAFERPDSYDAAIEFNAAGANRKISEVLLPLSEKGGTTDRFRKRPEWPALANRCRSAAYRHFTAAPVVRRRLALALSYLSPSPETK